MDCEFNRCEFMTRYKIIPPTYGQSEFYEYLYQIAITTQNLSRIPDVFFTDLIEYFESVEEYEKCGELKELMEKKKAQDEM